MAMVIAAKIGWLDFVSYDMFTNSWAPQKKYIESEASCLAVLRLGLKAPIFQHRRLVCGLACYGRAMVCCSGFQLSEKAYSQWATHPWIPSMVAFSIVFLRALRNFRLLQSYAARRNSLIFKMSPSIDLCSIWLARRQCAAGRCPRAHVSGAAINGVNDTFTKA